MYGFFLLSFIKKYIYVSRFLVLNKKKFILNGSFTLKKRRTKLRKIKMLRFSFFSIICKEKKK